MPKSIQEYLKEPYARILIPDEEGGFSAEILEFPGCFAEGDTADEAMQALDRAADAWIQAALNQGQAIPEPFANQGYGGKIALRLPRSLHRQAARFAERDRVSLNQFLVSAIATYVGAEDCYHRMEEQLHEHWFVSVPSIQSSCTLNNFGNLNISVLGLTRQPTNWQSPEVLTSPNIRMTAGTTAGQLPTMIRPQREEVTVHG